MSSQRAPQYRRPEYGRRRPRARLSGTALAATAALALVVVVAAVLVARSSDEGAQRSGDGALRADVLRLETDLASLRKTVRDLARQALADLDRSAKVRVALTKRSALVQNCLPQLQNQIDDLQAYLAYGRQPRRNRVSPACARLMRPEFAR